MKFMILKFFAVMSCIKLGRTSLITRPVTFQTSIGELAFFNCSTTKTTEEIQWFYYPTPTSERNLVYGFKQFHGDYRGFLIENVTSTGSWNLVIPSVTIENAGTYECQDDIGRGDKSKAHLTVLGLPEFKSRIETKNVIGKNNWGIEPSQLILLCSMEYHGSETPLFEWKKVGDDTPISEGVTYDTLPNNHIMYNLTLKGDAIVDGSSYACYAKNSKSPKAYCKSGNITVVANDVSVSMWNCDSGSYHSCIKAIACIILIITPFFSALAPCVFWYLLIYRQQLKIKIYCKKRGPSYQCKILKCCIIFVLLVAIPFGIGLLCLILLVVYYQIRLTIEEVKSPTKEAKSFLDSQTVESQPGGNVTAPSPADKIEQKGNNMEEMAMYIRELEDENRRLKESSERQDDTVKQLEAKVGEVEQYLYSGDMGDYAEKPSVVHAIRPTAVAIEGKSIKGLAVLEKELFVLLENSSEIEVYDSITYQFTRILKSPVIENPFDLTTGEADKCLFIIGLEKKAEEIEAKGKKGQKSSKQKVDINTGSLIGKLNTAGELLPPWPKPSGGHMGRLSTYQSTLVVCLLERNIINEFSRDGELIRTVRLSPAAGLTHPLHAIKVTGMHYAVSHGYEKDKLRRICVVDSDGNIIKECKEWKKGKLNTPLDFIEDSGRSLLVAVTGRHRILLLNSSLKYQGELIKLRDGHSPIKICFDETQRRLFVATNKKSDSKGNKGDLILIFNIK